MTTDTTQTPIDGDGKDKKKATSPIILGGIGAIIMGVIAFAAVFFLMPEKTVEQDESNHGEHDDSHANNHDQNKKTIKTSNTDYKANEPSLYYQLSPMIISLGPGARARHLKITITFEIAESDYDALGVSEPRIKDILQTFLRAVDEDDLEDPSSMARLRAQILRRVQLVSGDVNIRALLITEYLLS